MVSIQTNGKVLRLGEKQINIESRVELIIGTCKSHDIESIIRREKNHLILAEMKKNGYNPDNEEYTYYTTSSADYYYIIKGTYEEKKQPVSKIKKKDIVVNVPELQHYVRIILKDEEGNYPIYNPESKEKTKRLINEVGKIKMNGIYSLPYTKEFGSINLEVGVEIGYTKDHKFIFDENL